MYGANRWGYWNSKDDWLGGWKHNTSGTAGNIGEPVVKVGKVVVLECLCLWKRIIKRQKSVLPNLLNLFVLITSQVFFPVTCKTMPPLSSPTLSVSPPFALKSLVCSVGFPIPVHYPTSLHNEPRVLPEPVASLRASHCSPVFYLLDNGKRRGVSQISASSWTSACLFVCSFVLFFFHFMAIMQQRKDIGSLGCFWTGGWFAVAPCMLTLLPHCEQHYE